MNKFKKYCVVLSAIVVIASTLSNIYALNNYSKSIEKATISNSKSSINQENVDKNTQEKNKNVSNILLIGSDSSGFDKVGRSDSMIILTIDKDNKNLKLTSLARDTLVNIPGHGYEKLTHAYAYGKSKLLLDTIEKNLNIDLDGYVAVNFNSFIDLVDTLGGVEVNVHKNEIEHLNDIIVNSFKVAKDKGEEPQFIRFEGNQLLNGYQALAYARIRQIDSIYERDKRQRDVLKSIANKLVELPVTSYPKVIKEMMPYVDVNLPISKLITIAMTSKELYNYELDQMEFPVAEYRESGRLKKDNSFVVKWDKTENLKVLNNFIYNK
ncbi:LCP family protein [Paraclostridium bifermentans]|uniref:LCP family protein n=2 Tax=Bacillota TaxID=1239 RepID=UPI0021499FC8|nr:LCP family protein [Paraclostridium bifermentans]MCR1875187.1 LCP family protein [Paraclostridium bifermentans]